MSDLRNPNVIDNLLSGNNGLNNTPEAKKKGKKNEKATKQLRAFWREEFLGMSEKEMKKYADNPKNPYALRVYCKMFLADNSFDNFYKLANQCEGLPTQPIELNQLPPISLDMFGEDTEDNADQ